MAKTLNLEKIKDLRKHLSIPFNKKIILCHGVFDAIHAGHIDYFNSSKKLGDILVVSLTEDNFVNKGFDRPFFKINERIKVLNSIKSIDFTVISKSPSSIKVIKKIKPNFYCKGPDYKNKKKDLTKKIFLEENEVKKHGGKLVFTKDFTYSSSKLINNKLVSFNSNQLNALRQLKKKYNSNIIFQYFKKLKKNNVNIYGESFFDKYTFCECLGKSGKEPMLVVRKNYSKIFPGGSLAPSINCSKIFNKVNLFSNFSNIKKENKINLPKNIFTKNLTDKSKLFVKERFIEKISNNKLLGVYENEDLNITKYIHKRIVDTLKKKLKQKNTHLVFDYGHGLISKKITSVFKNKKIYLNTQINSSNIGLHTIKKYQNIFCAIINESELRFEFRSKDENIKILLKKLSNLLNIEICVVTRGKEGSILYNKKKNKFVDFPAFDNRPLDKIGSGDTFLTYFSSMHSVSKQDDLSLFVATIAASQNIKMFANERPIDLESLQKTIETYLK